MLVQWGRNAAALQMKVHFQLTVSQYRLGGKYRSSLAQSIQIKPKKTDFYKGTCTCISPGASTKLACS